MDDEDLAMMPKKDITLVHIATLDELVSVSLSTTTTTYEENILKINIPPTTNTLYDNQKYLKPPYVQLWYIVLILGTFTYVPYMPFLWLIPQVLSTLPHLSFRW